jgi:Icc protein
MLLAQITDCHLQRDPNAKMRGINTTNSFHAVVALLRNLSPTPDRLLLSGDLSDDGSAESYQRILDAVLPLDIVLSWLPGNHDNLAMMNQVFPPCDKYFVQDGWQFVLLNSTIVGNDAGLISPAELDFITEHVVDDGSLYTAIALHHHALPIQSAWMDNKYPLQNAAVLRSALESIHSCRAVIFGHVHQDFDQTENNIRYLGCPATADQFLPKSDIFLTEPLPPGLRLIEFQTKGAIRTRIVR